MGFSQIKRQHVLNRKYRHAVVVLTCQGNCTTAEPNPLPNNTFQQANNPPLFQIQPTTPQTNIESCPKFFFYIKMEEQIIRGFPPLLTPAAPIYHYYMIFRIRIFPNATEQQKSLSQEPWSSKYSFPRECRAFTRALKTSQKFVAFGRNPAQFVFSPLPLWDFTISFHTPLTVLWHLNGHNHCKPFFQPKKSQTLTSGDITAPTQYQDILFLVKNILIFDWHAISKHIEMTLKTDN